MSFVQNSINSPRPLSFSSKWCSYVLFLSYDLERRKEEEYEGSCTFFFLILST